jgi:hypothetical protein
MTFCGTAAGILAHYSGLPAVLTYYLSMNQNITTKPQLSMAVKNNTIHSSMTLCAKCPLIIHSLSMGDIKFYVSAFKKPIISKTCTNFLDWIKLAQDRDQWRALVDTVTNLQVP